jgi:hypothetical protein
MICNSNPEYNDIWTAEDEEEYLEELREALSIFDEPDFVDEPDNLDDVIVVWAN